LRPLRIAHLTATFPPYWGGTGTVAFEHAKGLAARGHHVEVFTGTASAGGADDPPGVVVHRLEPVAAIGNAPLIPRLALLRGFDVVHFHHPFIFGTELTLFARLRERNHALVASWHNRLIGDGGRRPLFWVYEETFGRALARVADRNCLVSRAHGETVSYLRSGMRRRPDRFVELPNGVDLERFAPGPRDDALRDRLGIPRDATVILFVAALDRAHHFKRLDLVLDAMQRLPSSVHLLVVGGGELLDDLRAGAGERVHFAGPQPHNRLPEFMRAGDLLALPSDPPESFGLVQIEAMACGLPVVTSDLPGPASVVVAGETGLVARRGDAADLAEKLGALVALPAGERAQMGAAARELCERRYGWTAVVDRLEAVYADAVAARNRNNRRAGGI
jgi:glycosyltransferase involved in cell wall biosynthesis